MSVILYSGNALYGDRQSLTDPLCENKDLVSSVADGTAYRSSDRKVYVNSRNDIAFGVVGDGIGRFADPKLRGKLFTALRKYLNLRILCKMREIDGNSDLSDVITKTRTKALEEIIGDNTVIFMSTVGVFRYKQNENQLISIINKDSRVAYGSRATSVLTALTIGAEELAAIDTSKFVDCLTSAFSKEKIDIIKLSDMKTFELKV